jgi:hypothetical protein
MTENFLKHRVLSQGERLIEAMEKNDNGKGYSPVIFSISLVERVKALKENISVLILVSGFKIPVALPYAALKQKIYRPDFKTDDAEILDLTGVTGKAAIICEAENLKPGDLAADGSIYLGLYGDKDWFVADRDVKESNGRENLVMKFNQAAAYARDLRAHGHDDWILPPGADDPKEPNILSEMFNNKNLGAFRGTYNESGDGTYGWYWSSTLQQSDSDRAFEKKFSDGTIDFLSVKHTLSVRCVRAVPRP